jgi:hypothetical protein
MRLPHWLRRRPPRDALHGTSELSVADLIGVWQQIIVGEGKHWVLFRHGTCVVFTDSASGLRERAVDLMREWGPVHVGSPAADFDILPLSDHRGWAVTCHHPDILTYVDPAEVGEIADDLTVGVYGRSKRHEDASDLVVIHVHTAQDAV